jgi:hypothetical protein
MEIFLFSWEEKKHAGLDDLLMIPCTYGRSQKTG